MLWRLYSCNRLTWTMASLALGSLISRGVSYLDVKQGMRVQLDAHGLLDEVGEALLVVVLDLCPLLMEFVVINVLKEASELG